MTARARVPSFGESPKLITQSAQTGAKLNLIRNCVASLRPAASGMGCRGMCRDATRRRHFPPIEGAGLDWPGSLATGGVFAIYVAHFEKARQPLEIGNKWEPEALTTAGHGLAQTGDRSFCPRPSVFRQQLAQIFTAMDIFSENSVRMLTYHKTQGGQGRSVRGTPVQEGDQTPS